jgi:thiamine biosynthesis protein ThiS
MLTVNDEPLDYEDGMTVSDILKRKNYIFRMLAVWIDGEFVARDQYDVAKVADGADVKVVHMIAGG